MSIYTYVLDIDDLLTEIPADSIVSREVMTADGVKAILFGFAPGQELSEHTASRPAVLHFLGGEAKLTLAGDSMTVKPGALIHMPANMPHSVYAEDEVTMLLYLLTPTTKAGV